MAFILGENWTKIDLVLSLKRIRTVFLKFYNNRRGVSTSNSGGSYR